MWPVHIKCRLSNENTMQITDSNTGPDYADIKHGKHAASLCALNILSILKHTLGSLDKVVCTGIAKCT